MKNEIKWIIYNLSVSLNLQEQLEHLHHEVQIIIWTTCAIKWWNNQMINELNNQWNQINILTRIKGYVRCNDNFKLLGKWQCKCEIVWATKVWMPIVKWEYCNCKTEVLVVWTLNSKAKSMINQGVCMTFWIASWFFLLILLGDYIS